MSNEFWAFIVLFPLVPFIVPLVWAREALLHTRHRRRQEGSFRGRFEVFKKEFLDLFGALKELFFLSFGFVFCFWALTLFGNFAELGNNLNSMTIWHWVIVVIPKTIFVYVGSLALRTFLFFKKFSQVNQQKIQETEETIIEPDLFRGANLNRQMSKRFPRNENEEDWDYVKRIFLKIFENDSTTGLTVLFGKSPTEWSDKHKLIANDFLNNIGRYKVGNNQYLRKIEKFLEGFGNKDPAY